MQINWGAILADQMGAKLLMEFVGTFFLALTVALSTPPYAAFSVGGVHVCLIYAGKSWNHFKFIAECIIGVSVPYRRSYQRRFL